MRAKKAALTVLLEILAILFVGFLLAPIYQMVTTAIKVDSEAWQSPPTLFPHSFTLSHFFKIKEIVPLFPRYLLNSFIYGVGVSAVSMIVAIPASYAVARFRFRMRDSIMGFLIYANMFAPIMLLVPIFTIMRILGLINTYASIILSGSIFTIPLSTWLLASYVKTVPREIEEAALVDGASRFQILRLIILPLISPALVAVFIYAFITGWSQQFILALVLIQDENLMPVTQGLYQFFSRSSVRWTELMAASFIVSLIPVLLFMLAQKYLIKGLTAGALKG